MIAAVLGFLNLPALRRIARLRRDSFVLAMLALVGVLVFGVLGGLLLAVTISILLLLNGESRPTSSVADHVPGAPPEPGLLVFRLNSPLMFINAKLLRDRVRAELEGMDPPVRLVLLDLQFSPHLDIESLNVLGSLHRELAGRGVALWLVNLHAGVLAMLDRGGLAADLGRAHLYRSIQDAAPDIRVALAS